MEHETLFTATKWEILKLLEERPYAPIEMAQALGSSLANVSQQLRLLELAGLVKSERVPNRDKGQPRVLYSLAGNLSYMISTSDNFVEKKVVHLSEQNKAVLRIWFLEDAQIRRALERAFWEIEQFLDKVQRITYVGLEDGCPALEVACEGELPSRCDVGGEIPHVLLRKDNDPQGYILYQKE